jgi:hypothetical protein
MPNFDPKTGRMLYYADYLGALAILNSLFCPFFISAHYFLINPNGMMYLSSAIPKDGWLPPAAIFWLVGFIFLYFVCGGL